MRLYFLRHAEAEDGPVDARRELTAKGRRDSRRVGRYLQRLEVGFDRVFASPLVRAQQTARWVLEAGQAVRGPQLETARALLNTTTAAGFSRWLRRLPADACVLLVGHEPSLSGHVRRLLGLGRATALPLAKGAVARVDTEGRGPGVLKLLVSPKSLP